MGKKGTKCRYPALLLNISNDGLPKCKRDSDDQNIPAILIGCTIKDNAARQVYMSHLVK